MSSPLAEAFFLWTILTVVMKHPLRNSVVGDRQKVLPHLAVFFGSDGDFIGYLLGG